MSQTVQSAVHCLVLGTYGTLTPSLATVHHDVYLVGLGRVAVVIHVDKSYIDFVLRQPRLNFESTVVHIVRMDLVVLPSPQVDTMLLEVRVVVVHPTARYDADVADMCFGTVFLSDEGHTLPVVDGSVQGL